MALFWATTLRNGLGSFFYRHSYAPGFAPGGEQPAKDNGILKVFAQVFALAPQHREDQQGQHGILFIFGYVLFLNV